MTIREAMTQAARRKGCSEAEIQRIINDPKYPKCETSQELSVTDEEAIAFCEELIQRAMVAMFEQLDGRNRANN